MHLFRSLHRSLKNAVFSSIENAIEYQRTYALIKDIVLRIKNLTIHTIK